MAIVTRHRADPADLFFLAPWACRIVVAEGIRPQQQVKGNVQRGRITSDGVVHRASQGIRPDFAQLLNSQQATVVAHVDPIGVDRIVAGQAQQIVGEIELFVRWFTARQVQVQVFRLQFLVILADLLG